MMDIDILLALQQFRNGAGSALSSFFSKMTFLGELNTALVIMAILYWCVSKEFGVYLMMGWSGNRVVNGLLKVTACAYRPWIRDARVIPDAGALATATGYSFPSGHSMNGATVFGGGMVRKDLPMLLRVLLGVIVVLIAFSRCYLGVHTPQDVLVGIVAGTLMLWLTGGLMRWLERHPDKDWVIACAGLAAAAAVAIFAAVKRYPEDLDAQGKLLVDGMKMANDTFKGTGWCAGFLIGWVLERRFVRFTTDVPLVTRATRLAGGLLAFYALSLILMPLIKDWIPGFAGTFVSCFVQMFYIVFAFPWCAARIEKRG